MSTTPCPEGCPGNFYDLIAVPFKDGKLCILGSCSVCGNQKVIEIPASPFSEFIVADDTFGMFAVATIANITLPQSAILTMEDFLIL